MISKSGVTERFIVGAMSPIESDFQIICNLPQLEGGDLFRRERRNHFGELIYGPVVGIWPAVRMLHH
jgi:hypothetical protein